jgi:uncharacterized protein with HEPN domain
MSNRQIKDYLQDILDGIEAAESFVEGMTFDNFQSDQKTVFAVTRAIEIIGEAAKSIPISLRHAFNLLVEKRQEVYPALRGAGGKDKYAI